MGTNKIEQIIGDIEEYIDSCKNQAFSNTKIIVERPQMELFLEDLRKYTPEEIKKYQKMLNSRDKILQDAKKKAAEKEEKANAYADHLVSEHSITKAAQDRAEEIIQKANDEATQILEDANRDSEMIRQNALNYAKEILTNIQGVLSNSVEDTQNLFTDLISSLSEHQNIVNENLREINATENDEPAEEAEFDTTFFEETDLSDEPEDENDPDDEDDEEEDDVTI